MSRREVVPDHMPDADIPRIIRTHQPPPNRTWMWLESQLFLAQQAMAAKDAEIEHLKISLGRCRDELTARNLDPHHQVHAYSHGTAKGSA